MPVVTSERSGEALGVAWLDSAARELGSTGGAPTLESARVEARQGLLHIYRNADHAVIYRGRTRAEGTELEKVSRDPP